MSNVKYSETTGARLCTSLPIEAIKRIWLKHFLASGRLNAQTSIKSGMRIWPWINTHPAKQTLMYTISRLHFWIIFMWKNCSKGGILTHHLEVSHDVTNPWAISHAWQHPNEALKQRQAAADPHQVDVPSNTPTALGTEWDLRQDTKVSHCSLQQQFNCPDILMSFCNCPVPFLKASSGFKVCFIGFCASVKFKYQSGMDVLYKNVAKFRNGNNIQ